MIDTLSFPGVFFYPCGRLEALFRVIYGIRPLAKLGKAVKIADTSNQRKAKRETMPAVAIAFRENAKPFDKADSVFNQDTFP